MYLSRQSWLRKHSSWIISRILVRFRWKCVPKVYHQHLWQLCTQSHSVWSDEITRLAGINWSHQFEIMFLWAGVVVFIYDQPFFNSELNSRNPGSTYQLCFKKIKKIPSNRLENQTRFGCWEMWGHAEIFRLFVVFLGLFLRSLLWCAGGGGMSSGYTSAIRWALDLQKGVQVNARRPHECHNFGLSSTLCRNETVPWGASGF